VKPVLVGDKVLLGQPVHPSMVELLKEAVTKGAILHIRALGGSMRPFIKHGTFIIVKPAQIKDVVPGEVVFYSRKNGFVAHRALEKRCANGQVVLVTKGDALLGRDPPVTDEQLMGKVTALKKTGRMVRLDTPWNRLVGYLISRCSLLTRWFYPVYKLLKATRIHHYWSTQQRERK